MQSALTKKINTFRVSIRKQQIQAYKKQKRRCLFQEQPIYQIQTEDINSSNTQMYRNILKSTTFQNLRDMNYQKLNNNIQMLIQIVGGKYSHHFIDQYQNLVCSLIDFLQYSYDIHNCQVADELNQNFIDQQEGTISASQLNHNFISQKQSIMLAEEMKQNYLKQKQRRLKAVSFDRLVNSIQINKYLKLIALIYYQISPKNMNYISKTLIIVRQILSYAVIDKSVLSNYRSHLGILQNQQRKINKSTALLILLNITYSQDFEIIEIVYYQNILYSIADWIECMGCFQMYDKQIIAGIYANCIEYLCKRTKEKLNQNKSEIQEWQGNQRQKFLFLNLYQGLLSTENTHIFDKLVFISVNLIKTSRDQGLACLNYLIQLSYNFVLNIITSKDYYQQSQDLFIILSELYDSESNFNMLLEFLDIILTKCTVVYYNNRNMQKNRQNGQTYYKLKGLQNISKLVKCCQNLLSNFYLTLQAQQAFFRYLIEFWCREELFGIRLEILNFVVSGFTANNEFSDSILDQHSDVIIQLLNQSCERVDEVTAQLKLLDVFLNRFENKHIIFQQQLIQNNSYVFEQIKVRLQDYVERFSGIDEIKYNLVEISLERIQVILKNAEIL